MLGDDEFNKKNSESENDEINYLDDELEIEVNGD